NLKLFQPQPPAACQVSGAGVAARRTRHSAKPGAEHGWMNLSEVRAVVTVLGREASKPLFPERPSACTPFGKLPATVAGGPRWLAGHEWQPSFATGTPSHANWLTMKGGRRKSKQIHRFCFRSPGPQALPSPFVAPASSDVQAPPKRG